LHEKASQKAANGQPWLLWLGFSAFFIKFFSLGESKP